MFLLPSLRGNGSRSKGFVRFLESMLKVVEKSGMMDDRETVRRLSFMMFSAAARLLRGIISQMTGRDRFGRAAVSLVISSTIL